MGMGFIEHKKCIYIDLKGYSVFVILTALLHRKYKIGVKKNKKI